MKKLTYLFLALIIAACSSDDDSNSVSINPDLVGAWSGIITDSEGTGGTANQIFTLNSDATGSVSNLWDDGETFSSPLVWSSTSSTVTFTTTVDNETESSEYELSNNNNTVVLTRSNGIVNVYTRI